MRRFLFKDGFFLVDGEFRRCDLRTIGSTISDLDSELKVGKGDIVVPLNGLHGVPGLINSHDHLEFNLFPQGKFCRYRAGACSLARL